VVSRWISGYLPLPLLTKEKGEHTSSALYNSMAPSIPIGKPSHFSFSGSVGRTKRWYVYPFDVEESLPMFNYVETGDNVLQLRHSVPRSPLGRKSLGLGGMDN
jgi:hypothetical protein